MGTTSMGSVSMASRLESCSQLFKIALTPLSLRL